MLRHDQRFPTCSIDEIIDEDVLHARQAFVARTQQCFAVKAGVDGFLDMARKSFCETTEGKNRS
jgi:DNA mismatch repair protein MSH4